MKLLAIENLSSRQAIVWDTSEPTPSLPEFASKDEYRAWCAKPTTKHLFVTTGIPRFPKQRSSSAANEIVTMKVVVAEFDAPHAAVIDFGKSPFAPSWACETYSGHLRLWWELPIEITLDNDTHRKEFLQIFFKEVKANKLSPGFALEESVNAYQYYEIGRKWQCVNEMPTIPEDLLVGWSFRACANKWPAERTAVKFEDVRKECSVRWPNCGIAWETFGPGIRVHRWWVEGADANSGIVTEHGVRCWTGDQTFVPWSSILGADWIRSKSDRVVGSAIAGWYFESRTTKYWSRECGGVWHSFMPSDVVRRLAAKGISPVRDKSTGNSLSDQALTMIQDTAAVHAIYPAFYRKESVIDIGGIRYLNTSTIQPLQPAELDDKPVGWGIGFPWIANYMERLLGEIPRKYYLHWLAHYYRQAIEGKPGRGLAAFLAGPTNTGKTYLNRQIHHKLFGGSADASKFMVGGDMFNSVLVASPFWTIDDAVAATDARSRERYSQTVKSITANEGVIMRGMMREGFLAPWFGRLFVTMNDDPESLKMLPITDISIKEKLLVMRANNTGFKPHEWAGEDHLDAELPYFARWLLHFEPSREIWGGRFGIRHYLDPDLISDGESAAPVSGTLEILEAWAQRYFENRKGETEWVGTASELDEQVSAYETLHKALCRQVRSVSHLQHDLRKLIQQQGIPWIETGRRGPSRVRVWRILNPDGDVRRSVRRNTSRPTAGLPSEDTEQD